MKKLLTIDNVSYDLFKTANSDNAEEYLLDSRTYNCGLDPFLGSDCISSYVYLVKKTNTPKFIEEINEFISKCENANISGDYDYLETVNDFSFLHKNIENSEYDIFVTHFDMYMCQPESYAFFDEHELFVKKIEALSDFVIYAGSEYDDHSIHDFAFSYLVHTHKNIIKKVYKGSDEDFESDEEDMLFDDFHTISNTEDKKIILTFIKLYFANIPKSIQDPYNYYGLINKCMEEIIP